MTVYLQTSAVHLQLIVEFSLIYAHRVLTHKSANSSVLTSINGHKVQQSSTTSHSLREILCALQTLEIIWKLFNASALTGSSELVLKSVTK